MHTIFGREPALILEVVKAVLLALAVTAVPGLSVDFQQGAIVVLTGLFGLATAYATRPWQVAGFSEALTTIAVGIAAFGFNMPPEVLAAVTIGLGAVLTPVQRAQVVPAGSAPARA